MKKQTLRTSARMYGFNGMRPSVRLGKHGAPMRDPEGHESGETGDNSGGNGGAESGGAQTQDNAGQKFDPAAFWVDPPEGEAASSPQGSSAESGKPAGGSQEQQPESVGQKLMGAIQGAKFGPAVMNDKVIADLAEGKPEGFNAAVETMGREIMGQTITAMIPLMQSLQKEIMTQMEAKFQGTFDKRDNESALFEGIPEAKDPALRPMVQNIYDRALKLVKGDRSAATDMTKQMLAIQMQKLSESLGYAPKGAGDSEALIPTPKTVNWKEELLGR